MDLDSATAGSIFSFDPDPHSFPIIQSGSVSTGIYSGLVSLKFLWVAI